MNALELKGIAKSFASKPLIANLHLSLAQGKHLILTGPSGGGKTTLLRIIAGLEAVEAGSVILSGKCVTEAEKIFIPPHQRGITMVFQDLGLWPNLTVRDNVLLGLSGLGLTQKEQVTRADQALEQCEIHQVARTKPARLSGGEQQRVALARAFAVQPKLLLLDEPFNGVDLTLRRSLIGHLQRMGRSGETSIVWVSHNPQDALSLDAAVAVLEAGCLQEMGQYEVIIKQPQSKTMKAWLSECNGIKSA